MFFNEYYHFFHLSLCHSPLNVESNMLTWVYSYVVNVDL